MFDSLGWLIESTTSETINKLHDVVRENGKLKVREIGNGAGLLSKTAT